MRIVTYNFLSGGSARRAGHWALLAELAPDVVLAQECRPPPVGAAGAGLWARAPGRRWGTGVFLARGALTPVPVRGFGGWVVGGELDRHPFRRRPLRIFSIHCPAGRHGYVRSLDRILDRLAPLGEGADLVVGGDLNVAAGYRAPGDRIRMVAGERRLLDRLTGELGLVPCWQARHPGEPLAQTLRWSGDRSVPYHCDGIFVPRAWAARLESAEVLRGPVWEAQSDHHPVVAEVRVGRDRS